MKRISVLALAALLLACSKESPTIEQNGEPFVEGQQVTLYASMPGTSKVTNKYNSGTNTIDFAWELGDEILVTVYNGGVQTGQTVFTVNKIEGGVASFSGKMPADGDTFDVQYPTSDPDISSQTYSLDQALPAGKIKLAATGCVIEEEGTSSFTLSAANSALWFNLWGADVTVNSIKVIANSKSYVLDCHPGVVVGNTEKTATAFRMIVPSGAYKFVVNVDCTYDIAKVPDYEEYGKAIALTRHIFAAKNEIAFSNEVVKMDAVELHTIIWAPVNLGYHPLNYTYGQYYQFGRVAGSGYFYSHAKEQTKIDAGDIQTYSDETPSSTPRTQPDADKFYCSEYDWYVSASSTKLPAWPLKSGDAGYSEGYIANPCPSGWTVPTKSQLEELLGDNTSQTMTTGTHGLTENLPGRYFNGTSDNENTGVFLPAGGYLPMNGGTCTFQRDESVDYWSSSASGDAAYYFRFVKTSGKILGPGIGPTAQRAYGFSVRCVKEEE